MKMISSRFAAILATTIFVGFIFLTPARAAAGNTAARNADAGGSRIHVTNVEELYAAVNNPANADFKIVLAPGVYGLSPSDAGGQPRANGGRLELQTDMSLIGVWGDRSAVVIDAIGLPAASFAGGSVPFAAIRVGRGRNAIEWLTVQNGRGGQGNIVTSLDDGGTPHIRVAHIASAGASNNLSIGNLGAGRSGKTMEVDIVDNDLFDAAAIGFRNGFRIRNEGIGSVVNARLIANRIHGNQFNLIVNAGAVGSAISVFSLGNHYYDNAAGLILVGGLSGATGNTITYSGNADRFENNNVAPLFFDQGGLLILGGDRLANGTLGAGSNTVNATLFANRMSGNAVADLMAVGGRSLAPAFISTVTGNRANLRLIGMPRRPEVVEVFADNVPDDPAAGNSVTVCRGLFRLRCEP